MWLKFGVSDNILVGIEDVPSGKTVVSCPYCGSKLTAKKGRIKEHHFAHTGQTCRYVALRDWAKPTLRERGDIPSLIWSKEYFPRLS